MAKVHRMADEAVKRFRDFCFGRTVDKELRHLIGKVVAGRSVNWPILLATFRTRSESFPRTMIDGGLSSGAEFPAILAQRFCTFSKYSLGK